MRIDEVIDKMIVEVKEDLKVPEYDWYKVPHVGYVEEVLLAADDLRKVFRDIYGNSWDKLLDIRDIALEVIKVALILVVYCEKHLDVIIKTEPPKEK